MRVSRQPSLGIALPALEREAPRKGGVTKSCSDHTLLANRGQQDSTGSGRNCKMKKRTVATWNVQTMLARDNQLERRTVMIARELQLLQLLSRKHVLRHKANSRKRTIPSSWFGRP